MDDRLKKIVIYVVLAVWVANFVVSALVETYKPPPEIGTAFMTILGLIGLAQVGSKKDKDDDDKDAR